MNKVASFLSLSLPLFSTVVFSAGQAAKLSGGAITLDSATKFDLVNADMKWIEYH
jgi:hypothetical protein